MNKENTQKNLENEKKVRERKSCRVRVREKYSGGSHSFLNIISLFSSFLLQASCFGFNMNFPSIFSILIPEDFDAALKKGLCKCKNVSTKKIERQFVSLRIALKCD